MPVDSITKSLTMAGVMEGKHNLDIQMLVNPVVHKYITMIGKKAEIDYIDKFSPDQKERSQQKEALFSNRILEEAIDELGDVPETEKDEGDILMEQTLDALEGGEVSEQPEPQVEEPMPEEEQEEKPRGLMSREGM